MRIKCIVFNYNIAQPNQYLCSGIFIFDIFKWSIKIHTTPKYWKLLGGAEVTSRLVLISDGIIKVNMINSTRSNTRNFMNDNVIKTENKRWKNTVIPIITTWVQLIVPRISCKQKPHIGGENNLYRTLC